MKMNSYEPPSTEKRLWPKLPDNTLVETYKTASGLMKVYRVGGANVSVSPLSISTGLGLGADSLASSTLHGPQSSLTP